MTTTPILDPELESKERAPPLLVTITAEDKSLEHVAVALALSIARSDSRLSIRKLRGSGCYAVESTPMDANEAADLLDRVQGALVRGNQ